MSKFIYCESTGGGMIYREVGRWKGFYDFRFLHGWMDGDVINQDINLLRWVAKAKIGDYYEHRLGVCFKVNSK